MYERYIAVDNACAWPNLTKMPDGAIVATIFNQPCHGLWEGDVECWASEDGRFWSKRGVPAPHEPGTNRMNVCAGLAANGDLIVMASGYTSRPKRPEPCPVWAHDSMDEYVSKSKNPEAGPKRMLAPWVCRSSDGGRTWSHAETVAFPEGIQKFAPFGTIVAAPGGDLLGTCYSEGGKSWVMRSHDDGRTWPEYALIAEGRNETNLLHLGRNEWLAIARSAIKQGMGLYRSTDAGVTWAHEGDLTMRAQEPGHLLRLADGRILLSFGIRHVGLQAVGVRLSADEGRTWSNARLLVRYDPHGDSGYPASVQMPDGTIVTAYYSSQSADHHRYHMGVVRWVATVEDVEFAPYY